MVISIDHSHQNQFERERERKMKKKKDDSSFWKSSQFNNWLIKNAYRADVNPIMEQTVDTFHTTNSTDLLITDRIIGKRERKRERERVAQRHLIRKKIRKEEKNIERIITHLLSGLGSERESKSNKSGICGTWTNRRQLTAQFGIRGGG